MYRAPLNRELTSLHTERPGPKDPPAKQLILTIAWRMALLVWAAVLIFAPRSEAQQAQAPAPTGKGQYADLTSDGPQKRQGNLFIAEKNVDLQYAGMRLRADRMEFNDSTREALAQGHVLFDYQNEHLQADEARYNLGTGIGKFTNVRGTVKILRR